MDKRKSKFLKKVCGRDDAALLTPVGYIDGGAVDEIIRL
jgi:hypothetical protein